MSLVATVAPISAIAELLFRFLYIYAVGLFILYLGLFCSHLVKD